MVTTPERFRSARRLLNALVVPLIRAGLAGPHMVMLTVEGRSTGRRYSTPVKLVVDGDKRWLVAPVKSRSWVKNARAAGWVELSRAGKSERALVTEVDAGEAGPVLRSYLQGNGVTRSFFEAKPGDPVEAFVQEAHLHAVFRLSSG